MPKAVWPATMSMAPVSTSPVETSTPSIATNRACAGRHAASAKPTANASSNVPNSRAPWAVAVRSLRWANSGITDIAATAATIARATLAIGTNEGRDDADWAACCAVSVATMTGDRSGTNSAALTRWARCIIVILANQPGHTGHMSRWATTPSLRPPGNSPSSSADSSS